MTGLVNATIQDDAREALRYFTTKARRGQDDRTGDDASRFVTLKDGSPEWVHDLVREAHGRDANGSPAFLPDDYRYRWAQDALDTIAESDENEEPEEMFDAASMGDPDGFAPYTAERFGWLASHLMRQDYVDEAAKEYGQLAPIADLIGQGMAAERREIFGLVVAFLQRRRGYSAYSA